VICQRASFKSKLQLAGIFANANETGESPNIQTNERTNSRKDIAQSGKEKEQGHREGRDTFTFAQPEQSKHKSPYHPPNAGYSTRRLIQSSLDLKAYACRCFVVVFTAQVLNFTLCFVSAIAVPLAPKDMDIEG